MYRITRFLNLQILILLFLSVILLAAPQSIPPEDDEGYFKQHFLNIQKRAQTLATTDITPGQINFDVEYYKINLDVNLSQKSINGSVAITAIPLLNPLTEIKLDLSDTLAVDSVTSLTGTLSYTHSNDVITVSLPESMQSDKFTIQVWYHGIPYPFGFGSFMIQPTDEQEAVLSTLSEPFYARTWWPCKDHPSDKADSVDMYVRIDSSLTVVSNGNLIDKVNHGDGTATTHWHESYPITTYLVSIAAAEYDYYLHTFEFNNKSMPVEFYLLPEDNNKTLRWKNERVLPMLRVFSELFGEYPFMDEKYAHVQFKTAFGGAMEHQTCSHMGSFREDIVAHELAHQWWGDMITTDNWHDIWLNEGFARFCEALWFEEAYSKEEYHNYWNRRTSLDGRVYVESNESVMAIFSRVVYDRGGFILHTLRYQVGDSTFFQILRSYANSKHRFSTATTADFQQIVEDVTGDNYTQFFDQWIYNGSKPNYLYSFQNLETDSGGSVIRFSLEQIQDDYPLFITDIDVKFFFSDTTVTVRLQNNVIRVDTSFYFAQPVDSVQIDPDNWIINSASMLQQGDLNGDAAITVIDLLSIIRYLYRDNWTPTYPQAGDLDCDGRVNLVDIIILLNHLYYSIPLPCTP